MNLKKGIIGGIVAGIIIFAIGMLSGSMLGTQYAATPQVWKPMTGNWWYYMIVIDLIEGIIYGLVFGIVMNGIPGNGWKKGLNYGLILWLVATVPGMMMTYSSMAVPDMIVASWLFGGLISFLIAGPVIAILYNKLK